jgi:hypothetical protein
MLFEAVSDPILSAKISTVFSASAVSEFAVFLWSYITTDMCSA